MSRLYVLPTQAGGGSCGSFLGRSTLGCTATTGCTSWLRTTNSSFWLRELSHNMGLSSAIADLDNNGVADSFGDQSDPTTVSAFTWKRFHAVHRYVLGWLPASLVRDRGSASSLTLYSSSTSVVPSGSVCLIRIDGGSDVWWISLRTNSDSSTMDAQLPSALAGRVYVHRYNSVSAVSKLVAVLGVGGQYNDYAADFFVFVGGIAGDTASLTFTSCVRSPPTVSVVNAPIVASIGDVTSTTPVSVPVQVEVRNNDVYCAPTSYKAALTPLSTDTTPFTCNTVSVLMVPDLNPLEMSYSVVNSANQVIMSGGSNSQSVTYCGAAGETLTATFRDFGGDGYCCAYGGGSFYRVSVGSTIIQQGGQFKFSEVVRFKNQLQWDFGLVASSSAYVLAGTIVDCGTA